MSLSAGTRLGSYEIVAPLGAGGMGEVYRARDTRLGRSVAVKVLPAEIAGDAERLSRFEREARSVSSLNHPNIVTVHEVGQSGSVSYIVMELVEGRTLRELVADGPLPTRRLLALAAQAAEGLAKAHGLGIVHRDIKPENLMVTEDGFVKILDFGLAKLTAGDAGAEQETNAPTISAATEPGVVVGTVGYMSPEQASGKPLDFRSDQFSFGAVLYEMGTGKRAFSGKTKPETLAAIIREDPEPVGGLNPKVPVPLRWIIDRCLAKEPEGRYASTRDLARDLVGLRDHVSEVSASDLAMPSTAAGKVRLRSREALAWALAGLLALALILAPRIGRAPEAAPRRLEASLLPPSGTVFAPWAGIALSPDGVRIVFRAGEKLFVRDLAEGTARPLPGTEEGTNPFWSPDGRTIGFMANSQLKKIDLDGAQPVVLCDLPQLFGRGASWGAAGILFAPESFGPLRLLPAAGGQPRPVTRIQKKGESHRWPAFLPDGRHFVYLATPSGPGERFVTLGSLDAAVTRRLFQANSTVLYAKPGYLLFAGNDRRLMAQPFDSKFLKLTGPAFPVAERVSVTGQLWNAAFSVSDSGALAYHGGLSELPSRLAWFDRSGRELARLGASGEHWNPRLSPDGQRLAVTTVDPKTAQADIWIHELARGTATRLTFDPADDFDPAWSPDGRRIVFSSYRKGLSDLYLQPVFGALVEESVFVSQDEKANADWSPDGRAVLFMSNDRTKNQDLWELPLDGERRPRPLVRSPFQEHSPRFAPDGRYFAYTSNESGRDEIYVQRLPPSGERWQVSTGGGVAPVWPRAGHELFYIEKGRRLMSVDVTLQPTFRAGVPRLLFEADEDVGWDISADGQRLLLLVPDREAPPQPLTLVLNWLPK